MTDRVDPNNQIAFLQAVLQSGNETDTLEAACVISGADNPNTAVKVSITARTLANTYLVFWYFIHFTSYSAYLILSSFCLISYSVTRYIPS